MPDRSKGTGQMNCSSWSSRFGVGRRASEPIPEIYTVTKPWRKPRTTQDCNACKEDENFGNFGAQIDIRKIVGYKNGNQ
jgi:hypothetical protein